MKKIFYPIAVYVILSLLIVGVLAQPANNLLANPSFDDGLTSWQCLTGSDGIVSVSDEQARTGSNSILVTNRLEPWYSAAQNVTDILLEEGEGVYYATGYARARSGFDSASPCLVLHIEDAEGNITRKHYSTHTTGIDDSEWHQLGVLDEEVVPLMFQGDTLVSWQDIGTLTRALIYFSTAGKDDYYLDDLALWKEGISVPVFTDTEPEDTEPEDTEPEDTEPQDTEPQDSEPEDSEPEDSEPTISENEDSQPVGSPSGDDSSNDPSFTLIWILGALVVCGGVVAFVFRKKLKKS